jgi:CO/xanthine dehydrogenase Mo-binding subunit
MSKSCQIGASLPRIDALTKVTGREKYAPDYYAQQFLWAGVKRAGVPSGLLKAVDM